MARTNMVVLMDVIEKANRGALVGESLTADAAAQFVKAAGGFIQEATALLSRTLTVTTDQNDATELALYELQLDILKFLQTGGTYTDDMDAAG